VRTSSNLAAIMLKAFRICDVEPITETIRSANDASEMLILAQLFNWHKNTHKQITVQVYYYYLLRHYYYH